MYLQTSIDSSTRNYKVSTNMTLSKSSFSDIPTCYATVSVGTPKHPLSKKLEAIAAAGFQGIELGFPDLLNFACEFHSKDVGNEDFPRLTDAAEEVRKMCEKSNLKIVMLQPFANFEGWPADSEERKDAFKRAKGWVQIMTVLRCDMLQVCPSIAAPPSSFPQYSFSLSLPRSDRPTLPTSTPHQMCLPPTFESFVTF